MSYYRIDKIEISYRIGFLVIINNRKIHQKNTFLDELYIFRHYKLREVRLGQEVIPEVILLRLSVFEFPIFEKEPLIKFLADIRLKIIGIQHIF